MSTGNCDWNERDSGQGKDEPEIDPDPRTAIRWIVNSSMDFVECLPEESVSGVSQAVLIGRGLEHLADGFFGVLGETSAG